MYYMILAIIDLVKLIFIGYYLNLIYTLFFLHKSINLSSVIM